MYTEKTLDVSVEAQAVYENTAFAGLFSQCPIPPEILINHLGLLMNRTCLSRVLFLDELYRQIVNVPGNIIEFGVRWGQGLALYANLRALYEPYNVSRLVVGFDTFEGFPSVAPQDGTATNIDVGTYAVAPGYESYLEQLLTHYESTAPRGGATRFRIIKGDASTTFPMYLTNHPETVVALAYFDFDIYEPTKVCLEGIIPYLTKGSIVAFDELNKDVCPGETVALREVLGLGRYRLRRSQHRGYPSYFVVE
jgi:hypothetical protein